jgi:hypothetical protein
MIRNFVIHHGPAKDGADEKEEHDNFPRQRGVLESEEQAAAARAAEKEWSE